MTDPLAPLRARFLERVQADLEILRRPSADPVETARLVHRLAGSAGIFGFSEVSRLAAIVDDEFHAGGAPSEPALADLVAALEALPPAGTGTLA